MTTTTDDRLRLAVENHNRLAYRLSITSRYEGRYKLTVWLQLYAARIDELMRQRSDERMAAFEALAAAHAHAPSPR